MPKTYKSRLKPTVRTVTSTSGKTFKRVYYEKDTQTASDPKEQLKPAKKKLDEKSPENLDKQFSGVRKNNLVTLGNSYVAVISHHELGSVFNPKDKDVHSIQSGASSTQPDVKNLTMYGARKSGNGTTTDIVYRKGRQSKTVKVDGDVYRSIQHDLINSAISGIHSFMKNSDASLEQVASLLSKKYNVPEKVLKQAVSAIMNKKGSGDVSTDIQNYIANNSRYKYSRKIDSAVQAITKHFNEKKDIVKTVLKHAKSAKPVGNSNPKKIVFRVTRKNISPKSMDKLASEVEKEAEAVANS